ncbi:AAA family ATPase [Haloferula chungangensis]|uniref:AAA family ATPase n=1 Tax=Haloferula chungangensis TaxID=1048331 RepID=A0ABW2L4S6_9BACT
MRLISLHVRNYRVHRDTRVEFDASHNLIGGPNESGKSTLVEAAHRALFCSHRRGGGVQRNMQSHAGSGPPEVELEFEQDGTRYHLSKRFKGASTASQAELRSDRNDRWSGADTEKKLAELLGFDEPLSAGAAIQSWAHLWIRQGDSANDPTVDLNSEQSTLLSRLQAEGGAALMQSDLDAAVGQRCAETWEANFTSNGQSRASSELKKAESALAKQEEIFAERSATANKLESAVREHERATRQLTEIAKTLPELEQHEQQVLRKITEVEKLQSQKADLDRELADARKTLATDTSADGRIRRLAEDVARLKKAIDPLTAEVRKAREERTAAEGESKKLVALVESAAVATKTARHRRELVQQSIEQHRAQAALHKTRERLEQIASLQKELTPLQQTLAGMPKIAARDLDRLRTLESKVAQTRVSLEAIAAGVEWTSGDGTPLLDGEALEAGVARTITEACDLEVAGHRFRIRPGGGASLEELRSSLQAAEEKLKDAFESLGVSDIAHASRLLEERSVLDSRIRTIESKLETLDPDEARQEAAQCQRSLSECEAEIARLSPLTGDFTKPADLDSAVEALSEAKRLLDAAEAEENTVRGSQQARHEALQELIRKLESSGEKLSSATTDANQAGTQHDTLVKEHGDETTRRERIAAMQRKVESCQDREARLGEQLKQLQPDLLEQDLKRHRRSIANQQELRSQAQLSKAESAVVLKSDGSNDPYAALGEAREALARAREAHASAKRRGDAISLLHQLFEEEQQRFSDQLTEPLAERISLYLQCLFGPEARARISQSGGDFSGLELVRPGGPFEFEQLSGGTKEQLAAAVRLAMAELLAESHGGCLPVIFDDAFTNSDAERIAGLQRVLDFAATRGLQIIVLTCTPLDYTSLGAKNISLEPSISH